MTGSAGLVGSFVLPTLRSAGHTVIEFDLVDGLDILDGPGLESAMAGCHAVVHLAALLDPPAGEEHRIHEVNVDGTASVLAAASTLAVRRFILLSSAAATGLFKGERAPAYLPLDEDHPACPRSPYAVSKHRAELLCEERARDGMSVTVLRAPGVWTPTTYADIQDARAADPAFEWSPYWEYGAFIDGRDLAGACCAALEADSTGYMRMFVSSSDITTSGPTSRELVRKLLPEIEWRGDDSYETEPYQALVRIDRARTALGWEPGFTWQGFLARDG